MNSDLSRMARAAIGYTRRWPVFPLARDKSPLISKAQGGRGFLDATRDRDKVTTWWARYPDANIGVPTGPASGLLVIDVDTEKGGGEGWRDLLDLHGAVDTLVQETGRGEHYLFQYPEEGRWNDSPGSLPHNIDVRGDGGYIMVAPSIHPNGRRYTWVNHREPAPLPEWLAVILQQPIPVKNIQEAFANGVAPGGRHYTARDIASRCRWVGLPKEVALIALREFNNSLADPKEGNEMERIVDWAYEKIAARPEYRQRQTYAPTEHGKAVAKDEDIAWE